VNKHADHCPLYRQSQIFGREGIDLDRSTLADWVGKSAKLLEPLAAAIGRYVRAGQAIFAPLSDATHRLPGRGRHPDQNAGKGQMRDSTDLDLCPR